jgi:hypothetical protein
MASPTNWFGWLLEWFFSNAWGIFSNYEDDARGFKATRRTTPYFKVRVHRVNVNRRDNYVVVPATGEPAHLISDAFGTASFPSRHVPSFQDARAVSHKCFALILQLIDLECC